VKSREETVTMMQIVGICSMVVPTTTEQVVGGVALEVDEEVSHIPDNPAQALRMADGALGIHHPARERDRILWTMWLKLERLQFPVHINGRKITSPQMGVETELAAWEVEAVGNVLTMLVNWELQMQQDSPATV